MSQHHLTTTRIDDNATLIDPAWYQDDQPALAQFAHKDQVYRIGLFRDWLEATGGSWLSADLAAYRNYLLHEYAQTRSKRTTIGLAPATVAAHLSTIRGRYQALLQSNRLRDRLYGSLTAAENAPADRKAVVDELLTRLQNAVHPTTAPVTVTTAQDTPDSAFLRLTRAQAQDLTAAPGIDTLKGLRDTALLALFLCTGIREMELAALDVVDLRQKLDGELAVHVRQGKGAKARLVPYGELDWCLVFVDRWLTVAGITEGAVFRSFWKGNKTIRDSRLSVRGIIDVVQSYPVMVDGELRKVNVHDLRRTYARRLYEEGMDIERIRQNLGHASSQTTQGYIGGLSGTQRRPPKAMTSPYNLKDLEARWMTDTL